MQLTGSFVGPARNGSMLKLVYWFHYRDLEKFPFFYKDIENEAQVKGLYGDFCGVYIIWYLIVLLKLIQIMVSALFA